VCHAILAHLRQFIPVSDAVPAEAEGRLLRLHRRRAMIQRDGAE